MKRKKFSVCIQLSIFLFFHLKCTLYPLASFLYGIFFSFFFFFTYFLIQSIFFSYCFGNKFSKDIFLCININRYHHIISITCYKTFMILQTNKNKSFSFSFYFRCLIFTYHNSQYMLCIHTDANNFIGNIIEIVMIIISMLCQQRRRRHHRYHQQQQ